MSLDLINLNRLTKFWNSLKDWLVIHYATKAQGDKADTAIQNVKLNGAILSKDGNNAVDANLENIIASLYSSSSTYNLDDYVMYGDTLYRCTTAISQAEAWTAAHWTKVSIIGDFINEINLGGIVAALYDATSSYEVNSFVIHNKQLFRCNTAIASGGEAWNSSHWTAVLATQIFNGSNPGLVPSATAADANKALKGDGTWGDVSSVTVSFDSVNEELHLDFSIANSNSNQAN